VPLTVAHAAAAWPVSRLLPRLPLDALVLGTFTPDFQYLFVLAPRGRFGHTPLGLIFFCLPIGLLAWVAYRRLAREVILSLLPGGLRPRISHSTPALYLVAMAILLGAATHIVWDSFTHKSGWAVRHLPVLSVPVHVAQQVAVPGFKLLQYGSTIIGSLVVLWWAVSWLRRQPEEARKYSPAEWSEFRRTATLLLCVSMAGSVANGIRGMSRGPVAGLGYAAVGGMVALILALLFLGWVRNNERRALD
jgi:Domain of unknown function (DUF4184)